MSLCRLISRPRLKKVSEFGAFCFVMYLTACATGSKDGYDPILNGTIAYPFIDETKAIGVEPPDDHFVIRSTVGQTEYSIEIPGSAKDYDIAIPLAGVDAGGEGSNGSVVAATGTGGVGAGSNSKRNTPPNTATTDRELVSTFPRLEKLHPSDTALLDGSFGVGNKRGPEQSPSYIMGISKTNDFYRQRKYELALVEINNLLSFYPTSGQLHKMKGTVLIKLQNYILAEKTWQHALDILPDDVALRKGLERLRARLAAARRQNPSRSNQEVVQPTPATAPKKLITTTPSEPIRDSNNATKIPVNSAAAPIPSTIPAAKAPEALPPPAVFTPAPATLPAPAALTTAPRNGTTPNNAASNQTQPSTIGNFAPTNTTTPTNSQNSASQTANSSNSSSSKNQNNAATNSQNGASSNTTNTASSNAENKVDNKDENKANAKNSNEASGNAVAH